MTDWQSFQPTDPETILWDAIVIGAGLGGSSIGYSLVQNGYSVLFLEYGQPTRHVPRKSKLKRIIEIITNANQEAYRAAIGRWPSLITMKHGARFTNFYPPMGFGPGGSSAVYGAALERFQKIDFEGTPVEDNERPVLPNRWPITYETLSPYYDRAEDLFRVRGTPDPLDSNDNRTLPEPPPLSARDQNFLDSWQSLGLSPYRLHVAMDYIPGCAECIGERCPRDCKGEGWSRALKPALATSNAKLLMNCRVERLESTENRVTSVIAHVEGRRLELKSRTTIVAAGALNTPVILRNSVSAQWPNGIGNRHDLVGRGLMFHISDFFALKPTQYADPVGPKKALSTRAFYVVEGRKYGAFQSVGVEISVIRIASFLQDWMGRNLPFKVPLSSVFTRAIAMVCMPFFKNAGLFATIMEDYPYADNRVVADAARPSGFYIDYTKSQELLRRITDMRRMLKQAFKRHRPVVLSGSDNLNYGHSCGTCRFGNDPATSVLDPENRVWDIDNLYVVDASFFPSSGGANPSLTIIANALRVADIVSGQLAKKRDQAATA